MPGTGQPSGKRIHEAIRFVKKIDKTSVKFYNALAQNEVLKSVLIYLDTDRPGKASNTFMISPFSVLCSNDMTYNL